MSENTFTVFLHSHLSCASNPFPLLHFFHDSISHTCFCVAIEQYCKASSVTSMWSLRAVSSVALVSNILINSSQFLMLNIGLLCVKFPQTLMIVYIYFFLMHLSSHCTVQDWISTQVRTLTYFSTLSEQFTLSTLVISSFTMVSLVYLQIDQLVELSHSYF